MNQEKHKYIGILKICLSFIYLMAVCIGDPTLGMESGSIPDSSITASHYKRGTDFDRFSFHARLNNPIRFWAAYRSQNPWIQVDLQETTQVFGIQTQGDNGADNYWISKLKVQTGVSVEDLTNVVNSNGTEVSNAIFDQITFILLCRKTFHCYSF